MATGTTAFRMVPQLYSELKLEPLALFRDFVEAILDIFPHNIFSLFAPVAIR